MNRNQIPDDSFCFELCVMNAGPDGRERVCAQIEPTLSPSAVLLPALCQSYCPISVQHAFLGMDVSDHAFLPLFFHFVLVYHPILDYNASGLLYIPRYLLLLPSFSLLFCFLYEKSMR